MNKNIYIIITRYKKNEDFTSINVSSECYDTKEKAIEFIKTRFNEEQLQDIEKLQKRNLLNWFEFNHNEVDYTYEIKILSLKEEF